MRIQLLAIALAAGAFLPQDDAPPKPSAPEVGKPAPVFRLNDHTGRAVRLGETEGHWSVLAFFPKAATPG